MSLRVPSRREVGERVANVRNLAGYSGRQLGRELGSTDPNFMSDIEHGAKKGMDVERLIQIANLCEHRDQLESFDAGALFDYMIARLDELLVPVRPRLASSGSEAELAVIEGGKKRVKRAVREQLSADSRSPNRYLRNNAA